NHWRREYERRRRSLQERGTRWAYEAIGSVARKEKGRFRQLIHRLANELVREAIEHDCSTIVFEDLTDIRSRLPEASWHHLWAFRRLTDYVAYKAPGYGVDVEFTHPENTSTRCSKCGTIDSDARTADRFHCAECGYRNHADYNAAKNIGYQYLCRQQNADDGGAPVGVRLNSGMLTPEGIRPHPDATTPR
ncbi:MAG: transposase, partial [Haloarculaceae archaeon]